ncbi:hypothetical protein TeGR_g10413 [Tetraparma gracilis]|uniref:Letm1 RBD domain-containing protein n=1 Tax=Tetraparma gracilis TaxID=2962635 RepID=A0ABQ6MBU4_9STRA|nr:hypothetical protein TeGR_g10413 [Tetraparma gracilis]
MLSSARSFLSKIGSFPSQTYSLYADHARSTAIRDALATSKRLRTPHFPRWNESWNENDSFPRTSLPPHRVPLPLPRSESLHLQRTSEALSVAGPTALLAALPIAGYAVMAAALFLPRYSLSHHFHSGEEQRLFANQRVEGMQKHYRAVRELVRERLPEGLLPHLDALRSDSPPSPHPDLLEQFRDPNPLSLHALPPPSLALLSRAAGLFHSLPPPVPPLPPSLLLPPLASAATATLTDSLLLSLERPPLSPPELLEATSRRGLPPGRAFPLDRHTAAVGEAGERGEVPLSFVLALPALMGADGAAPD